MVREVGGAMLFIERLWRGLKYEEAYLKGL